MFDVQSQSGTRSLRTHENKHLLQAEHLAEPPALRKGTKNKSFFPPLCFPDGFTPLMIASCSGGGLETGNSEEEDDAPAVISDFIYQGASLHNQTDRTGETALHLAARYSRSDAAKRLLEASADANIQDNMGRTPLHAAVSADAQGVFQVPSPFTSTSGFLLKVLVLHDGSGMPGSYPSVTSLPQQGGGSLDNQSHPNPTRQRSWAALLMCTQGGDGMGGTCPWEKGVLGSEPWVSLLSVPPDVCASRASIPVLADPH